jgi:phosphoribosylaminoimidazolecarboxamide formyltransferase/IMP cyclohydrolase
MPRALLSVSNKAGLVEFARGLHRRGFELISTGGTAKALQDAGLEVTSVAEVTGFPEMMDGRVKTLHPAVHGGILARRSRPDDLASAERHGIALIDIVAANLYPFVEAASNPETPFDALVEEIDIGGPSLVRAAAKNFRDVLIVVSPGDYDAVLAALDRRGGPALSFRFELARKAFAHTGAYDTAIASTLGAVSVTDESTFVRSASGAVMPALAMLPLEKVRDLRYGENPHQHAALYRAPDVYAGPRLVQGMELSYTNLLDLDAAARIVLEFTEPAAAVIKHTNPCGVATGANGADAYIRAREADRLSSFGGIVGVNRTIDLETAQAIVSTKIDAVIAPAVDDAAREILAGKPNMRVVVPDSMISDDEARASYRASKDLDIRSILGGLLVQVRDRVAEAATPWPSADLRVVTTRQPTSDEWQALRFAWRICAHVKSNTVIFTSADRTLAIGAGQMSRVDAVNVATLKASTTSPASLQGSVAASDAYIPFRDGLDAIAAAGATAVVQPGGSVNDQKVIDAANEHGLAMVFAGRRHFRH